MEFVAEFTSHCWGNCGKALLPGQKGRKYNGKSYHIDCIPKNKTEAKHDKQEQLRLNSLCSYYQGMYFGRTGGKVYCDKPKGHSGKHRMHRGESDNLWRIDE